MQSALRPSLSSPSCSALPLFVRTFRTTATEQSRIKRRFTHKPFWQVKKTNKVPNEPLTRANREFLDKMKALTLDARASGPVLVGSRTESPLKEVGGEEEERAAWSEGSRRCGVLARKIGVAPLWTDRGERIMSTVLSVEDLHVVRRLSAEEYASTVVGEKLLRPIVYKGSRTNRYPALVVGSLTGDPSKFTKGYCNLFSASGVPPKKKLARFLVTDDAQARPGSPLFASHFQAGQYVDVRGVSTRKGFQGVMKRWGFHGMPSDARGVTKSHRRPGSIGSGCEKGRVWPGQKMPGLLGGRPIIASSLRVLRVNHKEGVVYVQGAAIPGNNGDFVQIFDTRNPAKRFKESPRFFPTCTLEDIKDLPEEEYADGIHPFHEKSIVF